MVGETDVSNLLGTDICMRAAATDIPPESRAGGFIPPNDYVAVVLLD